MSDLQNKRFKKFIMEKTFPENVNYVALACLISSILSCVIGQLFLKLGVKDMSSFSGIIPPLSHLIGMVNFSVIIGLILYMASTLFWIPTLQRMIAVAISLHCYVLRSLYDFRRNGSSIWNKKSRFYHPLCLVWDSPLSLFDPSKGKRW